MLGQDRRQVRMVMLDGQVLDAPSFQRVLGREITGVQIVRHHGGVHGEQPLEVVHPSPERLQRREVLEVADVMADPCPARLGHAEGVLLLGATGEDRARGGKRELEVLWDVATGAPEQHRRPR